jgi:hypothetical protein
MFRSKFKQNDKLNRCAERDLDHVGQFTLPEEDRQGEHVRLIHEALNAFLNGQERFDTITGNEFDTKTFGPRTAQVVREFKTAKGILNFANQIDEVVGRKTVAALDLELPADRGGEVPTKTFIDIVVRFIPGGVHGANADGTATDRMDLTNYNRRLRSLKDIGRRTTETGAAAIPLILEVVAQITAARSLPGIDNGIIGIHGSSSGGRVALDLASALSMRGVPIDYVGVEDAAFFPNETRTVPSGFRDPHPNFPDFVQTPPINAAKKISFFQRWGNHRFATDREWTSSMAFGEIHGNVIGFEPADRTNIVDADKRRDDDNAHSNMIGKTSTENQRNIQNLLVAQSPIPG